MDGLGGLRGLRCVSHARVCGYRVWLHTAPHLWIRHAFAVAVTRRVVVACVPVMVNFADWDYVRLPAPTNDRMVAHTARHAPVALSLVAPRVAFTGWFRLVHTRFARSHTYTFAFVAFHVGFALTFTVLLRTYVFCHTIHHSARACRLLGFARSRAVTDVASCVWFYRLRTFTVAYAEPFRTFPSLDAFATFGCIYTAHAYTHGLILLSRSTHWFTAGFELLVVCRSVHTRFPSWVHTTPLRCRTNTAVLRTRSLRRSARFSV